MTQILLCDFKLAKMESRTVRVEILMPSHCGVHDETQEWRSLGLSAEIANSQSWEECEQ